METKRILIISDIVAPTGFAQVMSNILLNLDKTNLEIFHLGINYRGDPHSYNWNIYPAMLGGDPMGFGRIPNFSNVPFDGIFILNDLWVVNKYLELFKEHFTKIPPIIVYFPVDSMDLSPHWFSHFDIVTHVASYTEFAKKEILKIKPDMEVKIIPHGVDPDVFKKIYQNSRSEIKARIFSNEPEIHDSFMVLNANRNQPRKRFDLTIQGFALFARGKPDKSVFLYCHCGLVDIGFNILELCVRYGIDDRLITSNSSKPLQSVPQDQLNLIYNACDVGLNTSIGEGWSLTNHEHAATGAPQIVPNHSALTELYSDCGILLPVNTWLTNMDTLTLSGYVHPMDVANALNLVYENRSLYAELSNKSLEKFGGEKYSWKYIVSNYWEPLLRETYDY